MLTLRLNRTKRITRYFFSSVNLICKKCTQGLMNAFRWNFCVILHILVPQFDWKWLKFQIRKILVSKNGLWKWMFGIIQIIVWHILRTQNAVYSLRIRFQTMAHRIYWKVPKILIAMHRSLHFVILENVISSTNTFLILSYQNKNKKTIPTTTSKCSINAMKICVK